MPRSVPCGAPIIDDPTQGSEQLGKAMNLVDHDELAGLSAQEGIRVFQSALVYRTLEIEV